MTDDGLSDEAIARGLSTLRLFKRFCDSIGTDVVLATATSAVRDGAILDIGGGSAQLREIEDGRFKRGESHTMGALVLDDRTVIRRRFRFLPSAESRVPQPYRRTALRVIDGN